MRIAAGILLGAALGALATSFGLIDTTLSWVSFSGGNEWTPVVTGVGVVAGAVVGSTEFFRRHAFSFVLFGPALMLAIALRDHYGLQPPIVFLALFGLPLLGAAAGIPLDKWRRHSDPAPVAVVLVGGTIVALMAGMTWIFLLRAPGPHVSSCVRKGEITHCRLP